MKPDDWLKGMENEAANAEDVAWVGETRRTLRREYLKRIGITALVTLLVFQLLTLIPAGLYLTGVRSDTVFSVVSNTQEFIFITGLAVWLGLRRLPLWPLPVVGWVAAQFIVCWPGIALGWRTWDDKMALLSQAAFWWDSLRGLLVGILYVVVFYRIGQRWPRRKAGV